MIPPDFNQPADPELYGRVIEAGFAYEDGLIPKAAYTATLEQYHAAERARVDATLRLIDL